MGLKLKEGVNAPVSIISNEPKDQDKASIIKLNLYPDELAGVDIIGEKFDYIPRLKEWFGSRIMRGTALMFCPKPEVDRRLSQCFEPFLRKLFGEIKPQRAIEIGTLYGVTTALLAHYSKEVITVDINYQQTSSYIAHYFGVNDKIRAVIVKNNKDKKELLDGFDFDFAFIDAEHTYDGVKFDFNCVKKCGKVLFHDYGLANHAGVTKFIRELPEEEMMFCKPFALWEKGSCEIKDDNSLLH